MSTWFKNVFFNNFRVKLLALVVAFSLELYFYSPENSTKQEVSGLVVFSGLPKNAVVTSPIYGANGIPAKIDLEGPSSLIKQFQSKVTKIPYSVKALKLPTSFSLMLSNEMVPVPSGVRVLNVRPNFKRIRIEFMKLEQEESLNE